MINKDFFAALEDLEREKGIGQQTFIETLESALVFAYKKNFGSASGISVKLNPERHTIKVYSTKTVAEEITDLDREITLEEARLIKKTAKIGDVLSEEITPKEFGRIAAQTAKQVVMQRLREAERDAAVSEFTERESEVLTCIVRRIDSGNVYVDTGKGQIEGILMPGDQVDGEKYAVNDKLKVFVKKVRNTPKGPQIVVSRTSAGLVRRLFEIEIPEIRQGLIEIKSIARDAGQRTKIAVYTEEPGVEAVGACVGNNGVRVNAIVSELGGEKIDIVLWCEDPLEFIARALSPAKVILVEAMGDEKIARVVVPDDKLSLAIGRSGQNARLAARLTGWKIDVKPESAVENTGRAGVSDDSSDEISKDETAEELSSDDGGALEEVKQDTEISEDITGDISFDDINLDDEI